MKSIFLFLVSLIAATGSLSDAHGLGNEIEHPVSVVEADIYVNRFRTTMRLKCFAEDLEMLQGVEALEDGFYDPEELVEATQDHAEYLAEKITLRNAAGDLIPARVTEIVDFEIPEEGIRAGTLMQYQMGFVLEYNYDDPPEFITVQQDMVADGALLPSELKVLLKQAGSDVPYTKMLKPQEPETFRFDWDSPVLNAEASEKEWSEWFAEQREKTLGITSYSSIYSFIYITDFEIRHEVLVPLATLTTMMELERAEESFLDVAEQQASVEKIKALFSVGNAVMIDGTEVQPVFDRVDFYGLDLSDFAMRPEASKVSMANGRVGLIMSYSTKGPPTKVEVTWDKFNNVVKSVDSFVIAFGKVEKTQFSMFLENNTYVWEAPERPPLPPIVGVAATMDLESLKQPTLTLPAVATGLGCIGLLFLMLAPIAGLRWKSVLIGTLAIGLSSVSTLGLYPLTVPRPFTKPAEFSISDTEATQIFAQLHKNMFRAFDYRKESEVYDALAKSVSGDLLRELYLKINQSLKMAEQGGAVSQIDEVNLLSNRKIELEIVEPETAEFAIRCDWTLVGTIEHWGHIHQRTNEYEAQFVVRLEDDAWKIIAMENLDEQPGVVKQTVREF